MTTTTNSRSVKSIINSTRTFEGGGFPVRRPFPTQSLDHVDPFLLLDEMGPIVTAPNEAKGAPDHPHRGFETVTYMLSGQFQHRDSAGHAGTLNPGDVQWMTAGAGVVHSEMPSAAFQKTGGKMHGFQLWVNLPRRDKMIKPRYQDTASAKIPVVEKGGVRVKVIAGESLGAKAVIDTRTPILYLHFTIQPGASIDQPVPRDFQGFVHVFGGSGLIGREPKPVADGQAALLAGDGDSVRLAVHADAKQPMEALLIAGVPLREPVARYGPFVMNTREEIMQAMEDYRAGRMGEIVG